MSKVCCTLATIAIQILLNDSDYVLAVRKLDSKTVKVQSMITESEENDSVKQSKFIKSNVQNSLDSESDVDASDDVSTTLNSSTDTIISNISPQSNLSSSSSSDMNHCQEHTNIKSQISPKSCGKPPRMKEPVKIVTPEDKQIFGNILANRNQERRPSSVLDYSNSDFFSDSDSTLDNGIDELASEIENLKLDDNDDSTNSTLELLEDSEQFKQVINSDSVDLNKNEVVTTVTQPWAHEESSDSNTVTQSVIAYKDNTSNIDYPRGKDNLLSLSLISKLKALKKLPVLGPHSLNGVLPQSQNPLQTTAIVGYIGGVLGYFFEKYLSNKRKLNLQQQMTSILTKSNNHLKNVPISVTSPLRRAAQVGAVFALGSALYHYKSSYQKKLQDIAKRQIAAGSAGPNSKSIENYIVCKGQYEGILDDHLESEVHFDSGTDDHDNNLIDGLIESDSLPPIPENHDVNQMKFLSKNDPQKQYRFVSNQEIEQKSDFRGCYVPENQQVSQSSTSSSSTSMYQEQSTANSDDVYDSIAYDSCLDNPIAGVLSRTVCLPISEIKKATEQLYRNGETGFTEQMETHRTNRLNEILSGSLGRGEQVTSDNVRSLRQTSQQSSEPSITNWFQSSANNKINHKSIYSEKLLLDHQSSKTLTQGFESKNIDSTSLSVPSNIDQTNYTKTRNQNQQYNHVKIRQNHSRHNSQSSGSKTSKSISQTKSKLSYQGSIMKQFAKNLGITSEILIKGEGYTKISTSDDSMNTKFSYLSNNTKPSTALSIHGEIKRQQSAESDGSLKIDHNQLRRVNGCCVRRDFAIQFAKIKKELTQKRVNKVRIMQLNMDKKYPEIAKYV